MQINLAIFEPESRRRSILNGSSLRLLPHEARLPHQDASGKFARITTDAALTRVSGVSWQDYEYFVENPAIPGKPPRRNNADDSHIGVGELIAAIVAILSWYQGNSRHRHIILRKGDINVFSRADSGPAEEGIIRRMPRVFLQWRIDNDEEVAPRYIWSGHNLSAEGLTRWPSVEVLEWSAIHGTTRAAVPEVWWKLASRVARETPTPILSTSEIPMPALAGFRTHRHLFCERDPKFPNAAIWWGHWGTLGSHRPRGYRFYPTRTTLGKRHEKCDMPLLLSTVPTIGELLEFGEEAGRLPPRFAIALMKTSNVDSATTTVSYFGLLTVDSPTCGDVVAAKWDVLRRRELTSAMFNPPPPTSPQSSWGANTRTCVPTFGIGCWAG